MADVVLVELAAFEVLLHQLFVRLGGAFHQFLAPMLGIGAQVVGDVLQFVGEALVLFVPVDGLHAHEVDQAAEVLLGAHRQLHRHRLRAEAILDLLDDAQEVRAGAVHLVDEDDARHLVAVGLPPHGLRLRLDARGAAEHHHGAVEHAQRALHFDGEVDVSRGVDDVDAVLVVLRVHAAPKTGGGGGRDGDAAFLLLLHPVHDRGAVVDFADLVREAGVEEDALGGGGLAGVHMGDDADVAVAGDGCAAGHG